MTRFLSVLVLVALVGCGGGKELSGPTELQIEDITLGTGAQAGLGDTVTIDYIGTLLNGQVFDNSYASGRPFTFRIGAGQAIAGMDQGVVGMRVGGKRRLTIPPALGYGNAPNGPIPANSTLRFEVELRSVAGR